MTAFPALLSTARLVHLANLDTAVIGIYFAAVLGLGFALKRRTDTGEDFFLGGREMTFWVAGINLLAANMGALELMGWAASAYEYGILAARPLRATGPSILHFPEKTSHATNH